MKLLDLFCGAGGAAMGYSRAGFDEIVGVDISEQRHYPFRFVRGDALQVLGWMKTHGGRFPIDHPDGRREWLGPFDAVHASPPCQGYTRLRRQRRIELSTRRYLRSIELLREKLYSFRAQCGPTPYIIENVVGAPLLPDAVMLCGAQFGLKVYRHRLFETSLQFILRPPVHEPHRDKTPSSGCGPSPKGFISINSGGVWNIPPGWSGASYKNMAMGIDWMTQKELTEAIPPAYTEYIGRQLLAHLRSQQERSA